MCKRKYFFLIHSGVDGVAKFMLCTITHESIRTWHASGVNRILQVMTTIAVINTKSDKKIKNE